MKNKDKYDLNTLEIEWSPQIFEKRIFTVKIKRDESIIFSKLMKINETGSSAYNAWLEEEYDPKILTDKEKAYLSAVIKPFRGDVECIMKIGRCSVEKEFIHICMKDSFDTCTLPDFFKGTMYKGMERGKRYTLKELWL